MTSLGLLLVHFKNSRALKEKNIQLCQHNIDVEYLILLLNLFPMNNYIIREWEASYYCWDDRTWKYGKLAICLNSISFVEKSANDEPKISLDLRHVTGFQRKLVSLLYKAVVVQVEGGKPQWFSSLQNREETFYFLEHFWQQRLLLGLGYSRRGNNKSKAKTATGLAVDDKERRRKLFEVLYDSESTLLNAADSLYNQGEQLDHASCTMNTMHKDLNVAETILNGLDRWFTKWDIKPENFYEIDLKKEFPILYRKHLKESFYPATLAMTQDNFTVLDAKQVAVVTMLLKELTSIVVRTPWNITIVKSVIGEPDKIVDISAAHVVYIIKALQLNHGDKFEYEDSSAQTHRVINHLADNSTVSSPFSSERDAAIEPLSSETQEQHYQQRMSGLDEADLKNVCGVVSNMKSLAVGIGQEVNRQLDRVDQLSESVDKANHRIEKNSRKLRDKI